MSNEEEDIIKNPRRRTVTPEAYVPNYKQRGHEPTPLEGEGGGIQMPISSGQQDQLWTQEEFLPKMVDNSNISEKEVIPENKQVKLTTGWDQVQISNYILLHNDSVIIVGDLEQIREAIIYHCTQNNIPVEEFVAFKRCDVKVGIFVE